MDFKTNKLKWIVPVLALAVILESVVIVEKLSQEQVGITGRGFPTVLQSEPGEEIIVSLETENKEVQLGEQSSATVALTPFRNIFLDGVDVLVKYDPDYLEVLGVTPTDKFSYLAKNWIEPDKERVLVTMIETDNPKGIEFKAGEQAQLLKIVYKPLREGKTTLEISTGENGNGGTVLAGGGEKMSFTAEGIALNIIK